MIDAILVLNAGSSSIKFAIYDIANLDVRVRGAVDGIGSAAMVKATGADAEKLTLGDTAPRLGSYADLVDWLLRAIVVRLPDVCVVVAGHRVVHGGTRFSAPALVDAAVLAELETLVDLAPGHEPINIAAIRAVASRWPTMPQVACFDTAFHRTQSEIAQMFGLPFAMSDSGITRYGFHGLSYEYIASVLPELLGSRADGRIVVAHLGSGASMCAMFNRRSVATSMGYTGLDGLMMGTRCGTLDAGVVLHLLGRDGMSLAAVTDLLYNKSGLLGVSGISSDLRVLEASGDPRAATALGLFAFRAIRELGALIAVLGGLDAFIFTAGIGEHSSDMRRRICESAGWAGIILDGDANRTHGPRISTPQSPATVLVVPTDEEIVIARAGREFVLNSA